MGVCRGRGQVLRRTYLLGSIRTWNLSCGVGFQVGSYQLGTSPKP